MKATLAVAMLSSAWPPFGGAGRVQAQTDNIWVSGNKKLDFNAPAGNVPVSTLPAPGGTGYNGTSVAGYCQNAQYDINGQLLFFVIDGKLYDRTGALVADYYADYGVRGTQEVGITLWPTTCDKYLLFFGEPHASFPNILYSTYDLATNSVLFSDYLIIDNNGDDVKGPNIQFAIYEPQAAGEVKTLFLRDGARLYQVPINAPDVPNDDYYLGEAHTCSPTYAAFYGMPADDELVYTGGIAVKRTTGGTIRMALTEASDGLATPLVNDPTLFVGTVAFSGGVPTFTLSPSLPIKTSTATVNTNTGKMRGICFSPNGRYLYFAQDFPPYVGYVDLNPATPVVYSLGISSPSTYGSGQIACNKSPTGTGYAIYYPKSGGMGCLKDPDNPNVANWVATVPFSAAVGTMPTSQMATSYWPGAGITQYLIDTQTPDDKQITNLAQSVCCIPSSTLSSISTAVTNVNTGGSVTWSPGSNPLGVGSGSTVVFDHDFTVEAGTRLTVNNMTWRFSANARLVVKAGAYAKFDNCTLDALACPSQRWLGIEVWGDATKEQGVTLYPAYQGALTLTGSTIRNAEIGVLVGKRAATPGGKPGLSGGLLTFTNSLVRDCREGVYFTSYKNFNPLTPSVEIANRSRFTTTTWTVDDQYPVGIDFKHHVYMGKVMGIIYTQCTFQNTRSIYSDGYSHQLGLGINSLDANYQVKCGCSVTPPVGSECAPANVLPSKFIGLDHGIEARTATTARNFFVDRARFENNVCGVYANAVPGFEVHRSNFIIGKRTLVLSGTVDERFADRHRGIYSVEGYGFLVDDNDFALDPNATTTTTEGIVIGYSRAHNDMVFRNAAHDMESAYVGEGICADKTQKSLVGLHFQCNTNDGDLTDFWSRQVTSQGLLPDQTIRLVQGDLSRSADNTFDRLGTGGQLDFKNTNFANSALLYWWAPPAAPYQPLYNTPTYVQEASSSGGTPVDRPEGNCDARSLGHGLMRGADGAEEDRTALRTVMDGEQAAYATTRQAYDALLDDGSTADLLQAINSAWPEDAYDLRQHLLEVSPYVSAEAIKALAEEHVMPTSMLTEVSAANPDALRSNGLLGWLRDGSTAGLTEQQLQQLDQAVNVRTARTAMEALLAGHLSERTQAADLLLATYQADSVDQVDSVRAVWRTFTSPEARYAEVLTYLQQDDYSAAAAVADAVGQEFTEEQVPTGDQARMAAYITFLEGIHADGRTPYDLDSTEVDALEALAGEGQDRAAVWAHNLLCAIYDRCTPPPTGGDDGSPKALIRPMEAAGNSNGGVLLRTHPNPASTWVALDYDLRATPDHAMLLIRDVTGREMDRLAISATQGQLVWDARVVPAGTYSAELFNGGVRIRTEKLVVRP